MRHSARLAPVALAALLMLGGLPVSPAAADEPPVNPYKFLIADWRETGAVTVGTIGPYGPGDDRSNTIVVDGGVWQNDHDLDWFARLAAPPTGPVVLDSLPVFDVAAFIAAHEPAAQPAEKATIGTWRVHASGVTYFVTRNEDFITGDFNLRSLGAVNISVRDTAVWMFPKGVRIDGLVTVTAAEPGACLILLANRNGSFKDPYGDWRDIAAWFFAGLQSASVPVIVASGDQVRLEQVNNYDRSTEAAYLTLYAGSLRMMGPRAGGEHFMRLHHASSDGDLLIDRLVARGALPGSEILAPTVGIAAEVGPPLAFAFGRVTPNPSSGACSASFDLPRSTYVHLDVLDVQGREVAVLSNGLRPGGRHTVVWDAEIGGHRAPAGVYFLRLRTPERSLVRRLAIVR